MSASQKIPFLHSLLKTSCPVTVIDIGANPIDCVQAYDRLLKAGQVKVIGFEPNPEALEKLKTAQGPNELYLPYALGDGQRHELRFCFSPGMNSLLQPNMEVLDLFHGFPQWGHVEKTEEILTVRLDDVNETECADFIKIDVQGAELMILENALRRLENVVVIESEVEFMPMYEKQPLFSEIELFLRSRGFYLHRFINLASRVLKPLSIGNDIYAGLSQTIWGDAVFIRDVTRLSGLSHEQLLKMAVIMHDFYGSFDVVMKVLIEYDRQTGRSYSTTYRQAVSGSA